MIRIARRAFLPLIVPVVAITLWWFALANSTSIYYPPLSTIADSFRHLWLFERWPSDVLPSLGRMAIGFLISLVGATAAGVVIGLTPLLRRATEPYVEFLRAVPPAALLPFFILVLGIGDEMKIAVVAFGTTWPILANTILGVRSVDATLLDTMRSFRIGRAQMIFRVILPSASPQISAGIRTSLGLAILLIVVSEMVASTNGVGYFILNAQRLFQIPAMWSGIILLGLLGVTVNLGYSLIERRALRWYRASNKLED